MKTAEEIAAEAMEKFDKDEAEKVKDTPAKPEPKKDSDVDKDKKDDNGAKAGDTDGADADKSDDAGGEAKKDDEEGKFTADDSVEDAPSDKPADVDKPTDAAGAMLSPAEQKYIVDNIGAPMVLRGMRGDKEVEIKAYQPGDIPADFKFTSDAAMLSAQNGFASMERKAEQLLGNFRGDQNKAQAADYEHRENEAIRTDVTELQKAGEFPKFKVQPGSKGFEDDPASKQMAEVLDLMSKRNDQFLKEYQQGRAYRHIGFREAYELYQARKPEAKRIASQKKEDDERSDIAGKVGGNVGLSSSKLVKATVRQGTRTQDILDRIDAEDWER